MTLSLSLAYAGFDPAEMRSFFFARLAFCQISSFNWLTAQLYKPMRQTEKEGFAIREKNGQPVAAATKDQTDFKLAVEVVPQFQLWCLRVLLWRENIAFNIT